MNVWLTIAWFGLGLGAIHILTRLHEKRAPWTVWAAMTGPVIMLAVLCEAVYVAVHCRCDRVVRPGPEERL